MQTMFTIAQVGERISKGEVLMLAADEKALRQLPKGNWIAGTIPYFMGDEGGTFDQERIFVSEAPALATGFSIEVYNCENIHKVYSNLGRHALGVLVLPAFSECHRTFAVDAPRYDDFAMNPLVGWIAGFNLSELGKTTAKVCDGRSQTFLDNAGVLMKFDLPDNVGAELGIVNLFREAGGDTIEFPETGFSVTDAIVNGHTVNFAHYCRSKDVDSKLPLVSDYCGAKINTSFQAIHEEQVDFYAPVFKGYKYHLAAGISDYARQFESTVSIDGQNLFFSCNCILNYLYGGLEGKVTKNIKGPVTFGEIAYQLLNQTLAYVKLTVH